LEKRSLIQCAGWPEDWPEKPETIDWLKAHSSYHSKAGRVVLDGTTLFLKIYGTSDSEDSFVDKSQAEALIVEIEEYRRNLKRLGFRVPENVRYKVESKDAGWLLFMLDTDEGISLEAALQENEWKDLHSWIVKIQNMMAQLFRAATNGLLTVGIDPKPSNFVVSRNGALSYVDLVWPLNQDVLSTIHGQIQPVWEFRYFSKVGIMLNWFIQFSRIQPRHYRVLANQITDFLSLHHHEKTLKAIVTLPGFCSLESGIDAVKSERFPIWNVDILRVLGIQIAAEKGRPPEFLREVFKLSRANPHHELPIDRLKKCRQLLTD